MFLMWRMKSVIREKNWTLKKLGKKLNIPRNLRVSHPRKPKTGVFFYFLITSAHLQFNFFFIFTEILNTLFSVNVAKGKKHEISDSEEQLVIKRDSLKPKRYKKSLNQPSKKVKCRGEFFELFSSFLPTPSLIMLLFYWNLEKPIIQKKSWASKQTPCN